MNKDTIDLLEEILEKRGNCLDSPMCKRCPFKRKCLPTFLRKTTRATKAERMSLALEVLTNAALLDEETDGEYFDHRE